MGNSSVTPMTREELKKARFKIPDDFVQDMTTKIWFRFGEMQRKHPDLQTWRVLIPLDIDNDCIVCEEVCSDISKRIMSEYVNDNYPYDIIDINLCKLDDEYHLACIFQEENIVLSNHELSEDDISFNSETELNYDGVEEEDDLIMPDLIKNDEEDLLMPDLIENDDGGGPTEIKNETELV